MYCNLGVLVHCNGAVLMYCNRGVLVYCNLGVLVYCNGAVLVYCSGGSLGVLQSGSLGALQWGSLGVLLVCLFVGCLSSQQHASISQGRICTDKFTCCHTEIEAADQTFHLTQSQYTDTGPTSPSADPITPGAWQGSHWSANF